MKVMNHGDQEALLVGKDTAVDVSTHYYSVQMLLKLVDRKRPYPDSWAPRVLSGS